MPKPFSDNSSSLIREIVPRRPSFLQENPMSHIPRSSNCSVESEIVNVPKKQIKRPIILNKKDNTANRTLGLNISSIHRLNFSPTCSLTSGSTSKTTSQKELNILPPLLINNNNTKKQRVASVPPRAKYEPLRPVQAEMFSDIYHACRDKRKLYRNILKTAAPGLQLSGCPADITQRATERCFADMVTDTSIEQSQVIQKRCTTLRETKIKSRHVSMERKVVKIDCNQFDISTEIEHLETPVVQIKYRAKKRSEIINLDKLRFKPDLGKKSVNISEVVREFIKRNRDIEKEYL